MALLGNRNRGTFLGRRTFSAAIIWLLIAALVIPVAPVRAGDGDEDAPVILRVDGEHPNTGAQVSVEIAEATNPEQVTRAADMAANAVATTAKDGGKTVVLAIDGSVPPDSTQPPPADVLPRGETLQTIAEKIGDANPKGSEVLMGTVEKPAADDMPLYDAGQARLRRITNIILTIVRITGIAAGVTTAVVLSKDCPILEALPVAAVAASMSGGLQYINGSFQRWLVSRGLFRVAPAGEQPAPHRVTFGKLLLVTFSYISIFRAALYTVGLEPGSFFSLENLREIVISGVLGTTLEYAWDRFISESLNIKARRDPKNLFRHLMVADASAAAMSVFGTFAQILSASGMVVGKFAAGIIAAAGIAAYAWEKAGPGGFITRFGNIVRGAVGTCKYLFSFLGRRE